MRPEDLDAALGLLDQTVDALSELPDGSLPEALRTRLTGVRARAESLRITMEALQRELNEPVVSRRLHSASPAGRESSSQRTRR
jgi:hypothetical protein